MRQKLISDKFEVADFEYYKSFAKFRHFCAFTNLCNIPLISNITILFSNSGPKILKSGIFGSKVKDFYLYTKLCNNTNLRTLNSNMTIVFQNCCPKDPNNALSILDLRNFIFALNFAFTEIQEFWFQIWQYFKKSS